MRFNVMELTRKGNSIQEMFADGLVSMVHLVYGPLMIMIGLKKAKTQSLVVKDGNVLHFASASTEEEEVMILKWQEFNQEVPVRK